MSHRKFEAPRHGHIGFLPRKKASRTRGKIRAFPKDQQKKGPHMTAFMGYKVGMTHVVRQVNRVGSKLHNKESVDGVTVIETPPMVVVGIVAYKQTQQGMRNLGTVWGRNLGDEFRRRVIKNWYQSKKKAYTRVTANYFNKAAKKKRSATMDRFRNLADSVRIIAHTQVNKLPQLDLKRSHVMEIQVNGGSIAEKVNYAHSLLEKAVPVTKVFKKDEVIDIIGVTKGKGFKGVVSRWGVTRLPRKTHKGLRKVACIGAWHPSRVMYSVARAGQKGFFHRVHHNYKIYRVGSNLNSPEGKKAATTDYDITDKSINPMGGWVRYGLVKQDWIMVKGAVQGPPKRVITLRKSLNEHEKLRRKLREEIELKFIDTSSKQGHGKFQTSAEKKKFMGPLKKDLIRKRLDDEKKLKALKEKRKREQEA